MEQEAVISGIGKTRIGKVPELSDIGMNVQACVRATEDAGISMRDVDGLIVQPPFHAVPRYHMLIGESLGIYVKTLCDSTMMGGASYGVALHLAKWGIESGLCKNVLICAGEKLVTAHLSGSAMMASVGAHNLDYEYPFGATIPAYYALMARRYFHEYGTDSSDLAQISVATRRHAARNPEATYREPITVDDVLDSPIISSPLHRLDCSLVNDGGAAYLVSRKGTSKDPSREVRFLGTGQAQSHYYMGHLARGDETHSLIKPVVDVAGKRAFEQAGLGPDDIDVAGIYDSFTITAALQFEQLGFCGPGEAGPWVKAGNMDLDGKMPTNTHGGLLSYAHPGACSGMLHYIEVIKQLRGEAGDSQVEDAETALVSTASAVASNFSVTILAKPE